MRYLLLIVSAIAALGVASPQATAQGRDRIGVLRMFNNDALGDRHDRWRTGSYAVSLLAARGWTGAPGRDLGNTVETRLRAEIIAPADLTNPVLGGDRQYVGALSLGRHWYFSRGGTENRVGLDLVLTGPMTGMGGFQTWAHGILGAAAPAVLGSQIGNSVHPTASFEMARPMNLDRTGNARLRPFVEGRIGVETFLRLGADASFGSSDGFHVRDVVTGQRGLSLQSASRRSTFTLGGDVAWVTSSAYLPASNGYRLVPLRTRLRAGFTVERGKKRLFYGLTWLGREFRAQGSGQLVGSLSLKTRF